MKLLFLACLTPKSGNWTTANRIREHIESAGHTCLLRDVADFSTKAEVAALLEKDPSLEGALAIHLYKGGRFLLGGQMPFGVVFGGTDVNEDVKDASKRVVMERVLEEARFAVAFTDRLKEEAEHYWPSQSCKIRVHPQGVETWPADTFSWVDFLRSAGLRDAPLTPLRVFLLVCGLRRVKDPLYLVEAFSAWHSEDPSVILVIVGPKIDPMFTGEVEARLARITGVYLAPELSLQDLHAALKSSFALVNSSLSEGMSAAILEAMDLGVPVVVRNVPGNAAIVRHEDTGLLFTTPQEFVLLSRRLLEDRVLLERLVQNGRSYVRANHSSTQERQAYRKLLELFH